LNTMEIYSWDLVTYQEGLKFISTLLMLGEFIVLSIWVLLRIS